MAIYEANRAFAQNFTSHIVKVKLIIASNSSSVNNLYIPHS